MRLPSLVSLFNNARKTLLRFPLTLVSAATGVSIALYMIDRISRNSNEDVFYFNLIAVCGLGLSLFFSAQILIEKLNSNLKQKSLIIAACFAFLTAVFFSLPANNDHSGAEQPYLRLFVYFICAHLISAFIPYIRNKNLNGFWQYNRRLFIRFLTSALYSTVLFIGISLALVAISQLFDVRFREERYAEIWVVIAGLFNTWVFLAGVPDNFEALDKETNYPKGLKIFAQYILLPLLALYLIILYAYGAKIILQWNWPKGIISYLVICVAAIGSLNFLLLYPFGKMAEHRWIAIAQKGFYIMLLPLLVILFIAISMRLGDYGITVHRYIIFMMGVWLSVICLYTISGRDNIRFIPMSLAFVLLVSLFGPWSMFSVSERSQKGRLEKILSTAGILKNGKIVNENLLPSGKANSSENMDGFKNSQLMNDSLTSEVSSIVEYLRDIDRISTINSWYIQNMDSLAAKSKFYYIDDLYMNAFGLSKSQSWKTNEDDEPEYERNVSFEVNNELKAIPSSGYDWVIPINDYGEQEKGYLIDSFFMDGEKYTMTYSDNEHADIIISKDQPIMRISLDSLIVSRDTKENEDKDPTLAQVTIQQETAGWNAKLIVSYLHVYRNTKKEKTNKFEISNIRGWLLIRKNK